MLTAKFQIEKNGNHGQYFEYWNLNIVWNLVLGIWCFVFSMAVLLFPHFSKAALLYSSSANQVVYQDQTFVVEWYLDTQDKEINTVDLTLNYSKDLLEAKEASAGKSDIDLWVKPPAFSNEQGTLKITGGITGGANTNKLRLFSTTFLAKQTGTAKISVSDSSEVRLSDGQGNQAPLLYTPLSFTIQAAGTQPAAIESPTHPDQNQWYKDRRLVINFSAKEGEEYSYSFSSNTEMIPDNQADEIKQLAFENLPDDIYYFKLNFREKGRGNWMEAGVFRIQIDNTPPADFAPAIGKDPSVFDGQPFVAFATTDQTSGIAQYQVKIGISDWQIVGDTFFKLPGMVLGNQIAIKAVDAAGNEQVERIDLTKYDINRGFTRSYFLLIIGVVGIAVLYGLFVLYRKLKKPKIK